MKDLTFEELLECDGRRFTAEINGQKTEGVVTVQNKDIFLCQNLHEGFSCNDKKGYKYSWLYVSWSVENKASDVKDLLISNGFTVGDKLFNKNTKLSGEVLFRYGDSYVIGLERAAFGLADESWLLEQGWVRVLEITMKDIAERFEVEVENIRIVSNGKND